MLVFALIVVCKYDSFGIGIVDCKKRGAAEMSIHNRSHSVFILHRHTDFHRFLQHFLRFPVSPIFFEQQTSTLLHCGHSFGRMVPHETDHVCRQTVQVKLHRSISTVPPLIERRFELTRKSATFLWAEMMILPKVWREIFIFPAACS
jgi:hypothetical protein